MNIPLTKPPMCDINDKYWVGERSESIQRIHCRRDINYAIILWHDNFIIGQRHPTSRIYHGRNNECVTLIWFMWIHVKCFVIILWHDNFIIGQRHPTSRIYHGRNNECVTLIWFMWIHVKCIHCYKDIKILCYALGHDNFIIGNDLLKTMRAILDVFDIWSVTVLLLKTMKASLRKRWRFTNWHSLYSASAGKHGPVNATKWNIYRKSRF